MWQSCLRIDLVCVGIAVTLGTCSLASAQFKSKPIQSRIDKLDKTAGDGDLNTELRASAALDSGKTRVLNADISDDADVEIREALQAFQKAAELGKPLQQAQAYNNLGFLYLRNNEPDRALQAFNQSKAEDIPQAQRFVWYYNLGQAHRMKGDTASAISYYLQSLAANPRFEPAADNAWETALADPAGAKDLLRIGKELIAGRQSSALLARCYRTLESSTDTGGNRGLCDHVITIAAHALANLSVTPEDFRNSEEPKLRASDASEEAINELDLAYTGKLELEAASINGEKLTQFPWWSQEPNRRQAISELLTHIGDYFSCRGMFVSTRDPDLQSAFIRYTLAWMIDVDNWNAAELAAWTLNELPDENAIKDQGAAELVDRQGQLVEMLFNQKSALYTKRDKSPEEWEQLLRLHLLLGMLFESKERWGSIGEPRSAIFQWSQALRIEKEISRMNGRNDFRAVGVHARLGNAYAVVGSMSQAFDHYMIAAETYNRRQEYAKAQEYVALAGQLDFQRTTRQSDQLKALILRPDESPKLFNVRNNQ